jgi:Arc/MetJ-type ribon-helix-helix transcriptional regulator
LPKRASKQYSKDEYTTVRLPNDLVIKMDVLIGVHGYKSRGEIVKEAVRNLLKEYPNKEVAATQRFGHYNVSDFGARITDTQSELMAEIYFKPEGIWCDLDKSFSCEHINYALTVPKIQRVIHNRRKEGWKLPDV